MLAIPQRWGAFFSDNCMSSRIGDGRHSKSALYNLFQELTTRNYLSHSAAPDGNGLNKILVRFATRQDLEAIYAVEDESFSDPYPDDLIAKLLRDCLNYFFVAEYPPGTIAGYCVASEKGTTAHLISIGVLRKYRRRGFGTALIQRLLANLSPSVKELRLEVKRDNREAIVLYEELGFKHVGLIENYYRDGSSAVKMFLALKGTRVSGSRTE